MVQSVVKNVASVVSAVEETHLSDFDEMTIEFQSSCTWITHAIESVKREIIASSGIEDDSRKRRKAGSISDYQTNVETSDKENSHPNVHQVESMNTSSLLVQKDKNSGEEPYISTHIDVMSLKVAELRKHLRERGLDTSGLKKALQIRLQQAIDEENAPSMPRTQCIESKEEIITKERNEEIIDASKVDESKLQYEMECDEFMHEQPSGVEPNETEETKSDDDISMEEITDNKVEQNLENQAKEAQAAEMERDHDVHMVESTDGEHDRNGEGSTDDQEIHVGKPDEKHSQKKTLGQKFLKATRKVFSPNKNKNSSTKSQYVEDKNCIPADLSNTLKQVANSAETSKNNYVIPSENKTTSNSNVESKTMNDKRDSMVCKITKDEIEKGPNISKAVSDNPSIKNMKYPKVVAATPGFSSQKSTENLSSQKKLEAWKEARKNRLEEIRNKVKPKPLPHISTIKKPTSSAVSGQKVRGTDRKKEFDNQIRLKVAAAKHNNQVTRPVPDNTQQQQQLQSPLMSQCQEKEKKSQTIPEQFKKPLSPMETYEMSDRGESDSDDSDYSDRQPKKKIPKWAQREYLRPALERQFLDGPHKVDPDDIFPEVSTCDLEAIFDQKKKRYIKRTSSGNWTKDRVTMVEKLVYKRNMGFKK